MRTGFQDFLVQLTDDGNLVPLRNVEDLLEVSWREDGAAGVGGGVDDDGGRVVVDQGLHVAEVDHPVLVGKEVVLPCLDSQAYRDGCVLLILPVL